MHLSFITSYLLCSLVEAQTQDGFDERQNQCEVIRSLEITSLEEINVILTRLD